MRTHAAKAHHAEKSSRKWQKNDKFCQPNNLRQPQAPYFRRKYTQKIKINTNKINKGQKLARRMLN